MYNLASADFTASAALQGICGSTLQLHALRLAYAANSTLAKFREKAFQCNQDIPLG